MNCLVAAQLQARLQVLQEARWNGTRKIRYQDDSGASQEVEFRSDGELAAAIADLERRIAMLAKPPIRSVRINTSKGI